MRTLYSVPCGNCDRPIDMKDDDHEICGECQRALCTWCKQQEVCDFCCIACCERCAASCEYCDKYETLVIHKMCRPEHKKHCDHALFHNARTPADRRQESCARRRKRPWRRLGRNCRAETTDPKTHGGCRDRGEGREIGQRGSVR